MSENHVRWAEHPLSSTVNAAVVANAEAAVSAWTTDEEIARQAADLASVYGNAHELDTELRLFRAQLRTAAMSAAEQ